MSTTVSSVPSASSAPARNPIRSNKAVTVARAFAETAACELLILTGCCLLVVLQSSSTATREAPSFWFTLWGPFYLMYEFPVQAGVFLFFVGALRSFSLLQRSGGRRRHRDHLRLIQGGLTHEEPGIAGDKSARTASSKPEDEEPRLAG